MQPLRLTLCRGGPVHLRHCLQAQTMDGPKGAARVSRCKHVCQQRSGPDRLEHHWLLERHCLVFARLLETPARDGTAFF